MTDKIASGITADETDSLGRPTIESLLEVQADLQSQITDLERSLQEAHDDCFERHGVRCGDCGAIETIMRPGKYQCNACGYWAATIHETLDTKSWDEQGWHDPIETLKEVLAARSEHPQIDVNAAADKINRAIFGVTGCGIEQLAAINVLGELQRIIGGK